MGLLNVAGYYDALLGFLRQTVDNGFMGDSTARLLQVGTDVQALLAALVDGVRGSSGDAVPLRSVI